jgi:predicted HicB family RNase H-like nuclease
LRCRPRGVEDLKIFLVRVRASVKVAAERLAKNDRRSLANWIEHMVETELARIEASGKKLL